METIKIINLHNLIIYTGKKKLHIENIIWDSNNILFYSEYTKYLENKDIIINFIDTLQLYSKIKLLSYTCVCEKKTNLIQIQLVFVDNTVVKISALWKFLGSTFRDEHTYIDNNGMSIDKYLYDRAFYCNKIYTILLEKNIQIDSSLTPSGVIKRLFLQFIKKPKIIDIKFELKCYSFDQLLYKYFLIILKLNKFKISQVYHIKYSYLLQSKPSVNDMQITNFYEDIPDINKATKIIKHRINSNADNFFKGCLTYVVFDRNFFYHDNLDKLIINSFFGGRVEIFKNKQNKLDNVICWDMPSAYWNMLDYEYPTSHPVINLALQDTPINEIHNKWIYLCEVEWLIEDEIPVLPYRSEKGVMYPLGIFWGEWWGEELQYFVNSGGKIRKIIKTYEFKEYGSCYKEFKQNVDNFTQINKNIPYIKRLKTSFFGNFAQKSKVLKKINIDPNHSIMNEVEDHTKPLTNYYVASLITARCRIYMHTFLNLVQNFGIEVLSVNIDSIHIAENKIKIKLFKETYPEYGLIWGNGREKLYADVFFISNKYIFFKKNVYDDYYLSVDNIPYHISKIDLLKKNWSNASLDTYTIDDNKINFNSLQNRWWDSSNYRRKTNPFKLNNLYPIFEINNQPKS